MLLKVRSIIAAAFSVGCILLCHSTMAADKFTIGASLLTSQHPFYVLLANAMKEEAAKDGVDLGI